MMLAAGKEHEPAVGNELAREVSEPHPTVATVRFELALSESARDWVSVPGAATMKTVTLASVTAARVAAVA
jgi:hypothetical protein